MQKLTKQNPTCFKGLLQCGKYTHSPALSGMAYGRICMNLVQFAGKLPFDICLLPLLLDWRTYRWTAHLCWPFSSVCYEQKVLHKNR